MDLEMLPFNIPADNFYQSDLKVGNDKVFQHWVSEIQFQRAGNNRITPNNRIECMKRPDFSKFVCAVCGDFATGKHYGANACNGCRGFFRRTVVKAITYDCMRGHRQCFTTFKQRRFCKACRWDKCLTVGMDARNLQIQVEREMSETVDESLIKPSSPSQEMIVDDSIILKSTQTLNLSYLLESYHSSCNLAKKAVEIPQVDANTMSSDWTRFIQAGHNTLHAYLLMMVEWGKRIPGFRDLIIEDQITLFRSFGPKHVCLQTTLETIRSPKKFEHEDKESNVVYGYGNVTMPSQSMEMGLFKTEENMRDICRSMTDMFPLLTKPIKEAEITDEEFICFETLLLLDPNLQGLSEPQKVMNLRRNVQSILMEEKGANPRLPFRIIDLFHLLPIIDNYSLFGVMFAKDSSYFAPLGKCSKLVNDLFLGYYE